MLVKDLLKFSRVMRLYMSNAQPIGKIVMDIFLQFLKMFFFLLAVISKWIELDGYLGSQIKAYIL